MKDAGPDGSSMGKCGTNKPVFKSGKSWQMADVANSEGLLIGGKECEGAFCIPKCKKEEVKHAHREAQIPEGANVER